MNTFKGGTFYIADPPYSKTVPYPPPPRCPLCDRKCVEEEASDGILYDYCPKHGFIDDEEAD